MGRIRIIVMFTGLLLSSSLGGQIDTLSVMFRNSFEVFHSLRNDIGIYRDSKVFQGADFHPSSVAATGMGLISLCIADAMGWVDDAEDQVVQTLNAMNGRVPGFNPDRNIDGFFRHWIDMETGARAWDSEYSTIDSGIFLSGALFAYKYFCSNGNDLVLNALVGSGYDLIAVVDDPITGSMFLEMNADGSGNQNAITLPFNEYMISAWLTDLKTDVAHDGMELWYNHYEHADSLMTNTYEEIPLLTDNPNGFLSSFVIQFPYYLVHHFTTDEKYLDYMRNARRADSTWWAVQNQGADYQWGLGAGSANNGSGYHADKINDNSTFIYSPHIIAGFLPISPQDTIYLKQQWNDGSNLYTLPDGKGTQILWRKSLSDPDYSANEIQGVDYATMLFGLATLDRFLGKDFFPTYNDFYTPPCSRLNSSIKDPDPIPDLFIAFPNPTSSETFSIEMQNTYRGVLEIQVYDMLGRKYYGKTVDKFDELFEYDIDAGHWVSGLYVIAITGDGIRGSQRVMKE